MTCAPASKLPDRSAVPNRATVMLAGVLGLVAGCSTVPEPPREVRVPVPVPCIEKAPERPSLMSDGELLALDDYGLVIALARDRRLRQGYQTELEATIAGCR
jgi:hypothetical protein